MIAGPFARYSSSRRAPANSWPKIRRRWTGLRGISRRRSWLLCCTQNEVLGRVQSLPDASLRIVLVTDTRKPVESWPKIFPVIEIDSLRPADVARWLMDRYKLTPQIARYLTDNVGTDLYQLHNEVEKLQTYTGNARPIEMRDEIGRASCRERVRVAVDAG